MASSKDDVQINTFVKGFVTEASPLSFPPNASLDEVNFKLNRDGSRDRRLGIDFEDGFALNSTSYTADQLAVSTRSFYRWTNPNGARNIDIGVIQIGGYIFFANLLSDAPSSNLLNGGVPVNTGAPLDTIFDYALIGNYLIAVSPSLATPYLVSYNSTTDVISWETSAILVRDNVGVNDNLRVDERPTTLSKEHRYNLINQGWLPTGIESTCGAGVSPTDCTYNTFGVYPSNADVWTIGRIGDLADADVKKYDPNIAKRYLLNVGQVARGHFVINAFDRGTSRTASSGIADLPVDRETGRIRCVSTYAGRAWYSGILSDVDGGDNRSPNFNGAIFFSRILQTPIDLVRCYTEADPTNPDFNEVVDSDGGVLIIPEATIIVRLLAIKSSLFVFAENGVWEVRGDESGFRATSFQVNKIATIGVSSPKSIVEVNGQIFFWSIDGIYTLSPNDQGSYDTTSISLGTIQQYYNNFPEKAKHGVKGYYDAANHKIRWLYYSDNTGYTSEGPITLPPGQGGGTPVAFDLQALLDAGVTNILAGVGSDYRLNVDAGNAFVAFQHKDAVYNGLAAAGGIRPAMGLSSAGIAMGYNDAAGVWHNSVAISAVGDATFAGTVAANSILANGAYLGSLSGYTIADAITILDNSLATFNLQTALDAGVGFIKAGVGGNYEMIVDDTLHYAAFKHKDAVFEGISTPGAGQTAVGISATGIAMGYNDPSTGVWTNAVAITAAGNASFKGTVSAGSVLTNTLSISGTGETLQSMIDDIATFAGGAFNLQAALDAGVADIVSGVGSDYRMNVDTTGAFVSFQHKDAVYNGTAAAGVVRPALGISAAGIAMGYNDTSGVWHNAVALDATGNATFAGTIAANSIIVNSATVNGVSVGTIQTNSTTAAAHAAATGNPHSVTLTQIGGDLDDITNGSTYFKTTATQVTGAGRAANALDSSSDYIRSIQSTKIVVSATNPSTGVVFDGSGIRMYQSGVLKVNIPTSGAPSFSGDITGGANINITGQGIFGGVTTSGGYQAAIHANSTLGADYGVVGRSNTADGAAIIGVASSTSSSTCAGVKGIATTSQSAALMGINNAGATGLGLLVVGTTSLTGATTIAGALDVGGEVRGNSLRIDQTASTGASTANFVSTNKPGSTSSNTWISISCNGTTKYIPVWG